jgi:hypothetical protein
MRAPELNRSLLSRLLAWLALSGALLGYVRWGSELTSVTSFFFIRRSVPEIWGAFHEGLPEIGNAGALDALYWISIAALIVGVLVLFWLALEPEDRPEEPESLPAPEV